MAPLGRSGSKDFFPEWLLSPLDSRAWGLQESLLSPRILWYGPAGLIWKCHVAQFAHAYKTHTFEFMYPASKHKRLPQSIYRLPDPIVEDIEAKKSEVWTGIMEDYSWRDITFPKDRLPALAGVASELQKVWKDEYIAGLWRKQLIRHLGWYNSKEGPIHPPPDTDFLSLHLPTQNQYHSRV
jgi:hypothetical protein